MPPAELLFWLALALLGGILAHALMVSAMPETTTLLWLVDRQLRIAVVGLDSIGQVAS